MTTPLIITPDHSDWEKYRSNVALVIWHEHQVFAGKRHPDTMRGGPENYPWQLPQGGIDAGETTEQAAWRELTEETGLTSQELELRHITTDWIAYNWPENLKRPGSKSLGHRQQFAHFQLITDPLAALSLQNATDDEFIQARWVTPQWLIENTHPMRQDTYRHIFDL